MAGRFGASPGWRTLRGGFSVGGFSFIAAIISGDISNRIGSESEARTGAAAVDLLDGGGGGGGPSAAGARFCLTVACTSVSCLVGPDLEAWAKSFSEAGISGGGGGGGSVEAVVGVLAGISCDKVGGGGGGSDIAIEVADEVVDACADG